MAPSRTPLVEAAKTGCKTTEKRSGTPEVSNPPTTLRYDSICIPCGRLLCDLDATLNMGRVHTRRLSHGKGSHTHPHTNTHTLERKRYRNYNRVNAQIVSRLCYATVFTLPDFFFFFFLQTMNAGGNLRSSFHRRGCIFSVETAGGRRCSGDDDVV